VRLYSVDSVADSSADESMEVSGESLLTDSCRSIPEPMVYKAQPLESRILHQHNYQSHRCHYQPVHDPWSADKVKATGWSTAGWEPQPIELVDVHDLGVRINDRGINDCGSDQWLKTLTIKDKLDTTTLTLNAIQPKIQRLQRGLQRDLQHNTAVCALVTTSVFGS